MFAGKKSAQIREILISESAWEEMTCLFAPSKGKFYQSLSACIAKQQEWYNKRLDLNKIKKCSTWQRTYKKGRVTVLLYIEPRQVSKHYIYK